MPLSVMMYRVLFRSANWLAMANMKQGKHIKMGGNRKAGRT